MSTTPPILYSDLNIDLDTALVTNRDAVEQGLLCLFSTDKGERCFRPEIVGSLNSLLWMPINEMTAYSVRHRIF